MADLIITNGDVAADLLREAGRDETIVPWRDLLHEGPIVGGPLEACTAARVPFLAARFGLDRAEVASDFAERDALLRAHRNFEEIDLWFEHDLYDQLQLVQILAFFASESRAAGLVLVQADDFLGNESPDSILRFAERARSVATADLDLAERIWADLAMPAPDIVARVLDEPFDDLTFLAPALHRFLEELPAPVTGLGRTEAAALAGVAGGIARPLDLFRAVLAGEEAAFMGDLSFFALLDDIAFCAVPLLAGLAPPGEAAEDARRFAEARLTLTDAGIEVAAGRADHVALSGLDRWWAGTRLLGRRVWRYDRDAMRLVLPGRSEA